jgi:hypothetical protein
MIFRRPAVQLFLCGAACLFWELLLIRWLGCSIRVIGYFTNFVLISAFFGLGAGALLARFQFKAWRYLLPALCLAMVLGPVLGGFDHPNPGNPREYIWQGAPRGVLLAALGDLIQGTAPAPKLSYGAILAVVYAVNAAVFMLFGQWLGRLFGAFKPLRAYTIEIAGSLAGILAFAAMSYFDLPPLAWFAAGLAAVFSILEASRKEKAAWAALAAAALLAVAPSSSGFIWSRYYKIETKPLVSVYDAAKSEVSVFDPPIGTSVTVNNDYHQMMIDLSPRPEEHAFLRSWRWTYDRPYESAPSAEGPVLIVGAGTGNDVAAALRSGAREIDAVEIDPAIVKLGRRLHPERPYGDARVRVIVDDARSFFTKTDRRYAKVVFGFLDSHTLMSSFSSLRLDNFVYTREAMLRVKELLLPGGEVVLTFASNTDWMNRRLLALMDSVFDRVTAVEREETYGYSNADVYTNGVAKDPSQAKAPAAKLKRGAGDIPTDDWPFLYMRDAALPAHYQVFIALALFLGCASLLLLPPGRRRVRLPFFFMGAGFFLIESSNVVALSLLYGSTWVVNVSVFAGILALILAGNWACARMRRAHFAFLFSALFASVLAAYFTPVSAFLGIEPKLLQAVCAGAVFLGPVFAASVIFGHLIRAEEDLYPAYGSNLLGAVAGGCLEYLSILGGLKFLLLVTVFLYLLAFLYVSRERRSKIPL